MVEWASRNAARAATTDGRGPTFVTGALAGLPFEDASFDLVVSTFSVHHWSDPEAGIGELARVLRPGGRAFIWDLGPRSRLSHADLPDPAETLRAGGLRMVSAGPWQWPWRFNLSQRLELARD